MAATPRPHASPAQGAERVPELWLLRPGHATEFRARLAAFGAAAPELLLCPPDGEEERWAAALARATSAALERSLDLAGAAPLEGFESLAERAWRPLGAALERGAGCVLAVLSPAVLTAVAARALGLPRQGASALRVDPGRALLLRTGAAGLVLRRSNVCAPETDAGTALPDGRSGGAR